MLNILFLSEYEMNCVMVLCMNKGGAVRVNTKKYTKADRSRETNTMD